MDLSIVIVSYKCWDYLQKCLDSILASDFEGTYETICVDNNSGDGTVQKLVRQHASVRVTANEKNTGFAAANNQGFARAHGEFILFLNPDTELQPDALQRAMDFLKKKPDAGIVGAKLLNSDGSIQLSCRSFPTLWAYFLETTFLYHLFGKSKLMAGGLPLKYTYDRPLQVDIVTGAFLMTKREVLEKIGGFDESFFMYSEEDDLCYRALQKGWKTFMLPDCIVTHYGGQSSMPIWDRMFIEMHYSKIKYHAKHFGRLRAVLSALVLFLGVIIRMVMWTLMRPIVAILKPRNYEFTVKKLRNYTAVFGWYLRKGLRFACTLGPAHFQDGNLE